MPTTKERLDTHDRQIAAIRSLIHEGMRLVVETRKDLRAIAIAQKRLEASHDQTEKALKAFIDSMRKGGNGHVKRSI